MAFRPVRAAGVLAAVVLGAGAVLPPAALSQVTVNPGALDLLPATPNRPAPQPHRPPPARPARPPAATPSRPAAGTPTPPAPAAPAPQAVRPPAVPVTPPAILALPPAIPVPVSRPPPTPVVPTAPDAPGAVTPVPGGLRVTFGADRSDLNPATEAALREFARTLRGNEQATVNIYAYATGNPEDPSTPRRLSLARALAARAVMINEGVASTRIYPRALGPAGGDTDKDRVDVISGPPGPPSATPSPPPAAPAAAR